MQISDRNDPSRSVGYDSFRRLDAGSGLRRGHREGPQAALQRPQPIRRAEVDAGAQGIVSMAEPSEPQDAESDLRPTMDPGAEDLPRTPEPPAAARSTPSLSAHPDPTEFLSLYRVKGGALLHWRKELIDDWGAANC